MRTRLVVGLAAAAISVTAIACSSSSNPYAEVSEYCTAYAKAICQVSSTCQFDPSTCQTYQESQCETNATASTTATRQYNPGNVQACIDALNAAYGNSPSSISSDTVSSYTRICNKVFVGNAQEGASCSTDSDCENSADICASSPNKPAVCATPTPRQVGDDCGDRGDQCPANGYCSASTGTCVAAQTNGQVCSDTQPCDGSDHCVGGVCQALSTVGQSCSATSDCGQGLFCDPYTTTEAPQTVCVNALTFARGSIDCLGIDGQGTTGTGSSSGSASSSGSGSSSGTTSSSGGSGDGGSEGGSSGGDAASE